MKLKVTNSPPASHSLLSFSSTKISSKNEHQTKAIKFHFSIYFFSFFYLAWNLSDESDRILYRKQFSNALPPLPSITTLPESVQFTFDEFASRTAKVIPIALALIRTQTTNVSDKLKFLFDFNWNWLPGIWYSRNQQYNTNNIKASLSAEEYQNVLNHIDAYIETIINKKIETLEAERIQREATIDPKLAIYIAKIVNEQIVHYKYTLTDADVERIAEVVRLKLVPELNRHPKVVPFVLSQENLEEISKIVKQNIEIHRHEWVVSHQSIKNDAAAPVAGSKDIDIDEILFKVLSSTKLQDVVDQRIDRKLTLVSGQLSDHQSAIDELQNHVNDLKLQFKQMLTANNDMHITINRLNVHQTELGNKIHSAQMQSNEQLTKFLAEIDDKLSKLNEKQFTAIDNHIRVVLAEILGYKSADGRSLENADITNWIRSVFVAKELLEERLTALDAKFNKKITNEINQSAAILIRNISNTIKHDITIAMAEKQQQQSGSGRYDEDSYMAVDEARIRAIIKEALAVYDADKTGMVDYAMESAGGEILSTR